MFTKSLPIDQKQVGSSSINSNVLDIKNLVSSSVSEAVQEEVKVAVVDRNTVNETETRNWTRNSLIRQIRPGQLVRQYAVQLTLDGNSFHGRAVIDVVLDQETNADPIVLHAEGIAVTSVEAGVFTEANAQPAGFGQFDGVLEIQPVQIALSYILIVEYTGQIDRIGRGLYMGEAFDM